MCEITQQFFEEGRQEGVKLANISTARRMLEKGSFSYKEIAELTNLTEDEIKALDKDLSA